MLCIHAPLQALAARYRRIFEHKRLMTVLPPPINLPYVLLFLVATVLHHFAAALRRGGVATCAALRCCRTGSRVSPLSDLQGFEQRLSDKARRKELLVERSVKQYVEKFLDDEEEARANTVESLTLSTGEKVGALQESLTGKLGKLTEKLDELEVYVRKCTIFDGDSPAA